MWNLFEINNKDTRKTSQSGIVKFEQIWNCSILSINALNKWILPGLPLIKIESTWIPIKWTLIGDTFMGNPILYHIYGRCLFYLEIRQMIYRANRIRYFLYDGKVSLNIFVPNVPFLYPLETCFQRVEKRCIGKHFANYPVSHAVIG